MIVSIIVAADENNGIGKDNDLLWHLPEDMKFFKSKTTGHCIVSGRKNYESIPEKFRPLPNRTNIVLTRDKNYEATGAVIVHTIEDAITIAREKGESELFIIGGGEIYKIALENNLVDKIYLTRVKAKLEADTYFNWNANDWKLISERTVFPDEKNSFEMHFLELIKNK